MMWEARVKGRSQGRQRLQVCEIREDQKVDWLDLDLQLLQRLLAETNEQALQLDILRGKFEELAARNESLDRQAERLKEKIGEIRAASAALNMPRPVMEVQPLVIKGGHQVGASAVSELVTRITNRAKLVPGTIMVGPNIAPPGGYARETYVVGEDIKPKARIVAWDEPAQDRDFRTVADCVSRFEGALPPPFGGFPFCHAMQ